MNMGPRDPERSGRDRRRTVVRRVDPDEDIARALGHVLVDCVHGGASVGFMRSLDLDRAAEFWTATLRSAARGERIVLVAEERDTAAVVGCVAVFLVPQENQPHRAEIEKMLVHRQARRRGVGELLVLDTASADAERLYERRGWRRVGVIPDYALGPDGDLVATTLFWKRLTGLTGGQPTADLSAGSSP